MSLDLAVRWTEMLLAFALLQHSLEHLRRLRAERALFALRLALSVLLLFGVQARWTCLALLITGIAALRRFHGPYNGGSDRMSLLILTCLTLAECLPGLRLREMAFGYLALQLTLSYFIAGGVKIVHPEWRSGRALRDVFEFSAYPVAESLRSWAGHPQAMRTLSWLVMLLELSFPFALLSHRALVLALALTAVFHLANACLFGLNRFFWAWLAAYPSILWFQARIFGAG